MPGTKIKILVGDVVLEAELNNSKTAKKIVEALPFTFSGDYWGDEIYGSIPVKVGDESPVEVIDEPGTLGYWPIGNALCLFWGPTPVSQGDEIRPASPVNLVGKVVSGLNEFIKQHPDVNNIKVELA